MQLGIGLERSLEFLASVRAQADGLATTYVELFLETVWRPFEQAGRPRERWPDVRDALERLHPLAADSLLVIFGMAMRDAVDRESGRAVKRMADAEESA
jgi:sugar phosphate isomerase/epimerase